MKITLNYNYWIRQTEEQATQLKRGLFQKKLAEINRQTICHKLRKFSEVRTYAHQRTHRYMRTKQYN